MAEAFDWGSMLGLFGGGMKAGASIMAGRNANQAAEWSAQQADIAAGQAVAAGTAEQRDILRQTEFLKSKALARAGASGAGVSDVTVMDIIGDIAGEGAYRSQLALYQGKERARALEAKGSALRYEGKQAQSAGYINAIAPLAKSFYSKYGGGGSPFQGGSTINGSGYGEPDITGWGGL